MGCKEIFAGASEGEKRHFLSLFLVTFNVRMYFWNYLQIYHCKRGKDRGEVWR